MDDAQLVAQARAGDRHAYAAIYDRYADRVHDFCASMLRNRADAGEALQETFLVAFESLDRLAQPARLGPWLYALAHRAVLDRSTPLADDRARGLFWGSGTPNERPSRAELAEFVWQASAGLPEADRALLDLHLRQGLEGDDLARAAGVAASQADARVERLETQTERSLGALLVARTGRRSCPELFQVLDGRDGRLTAEFRDQVTAHCDDCETCNSRRRIVPNPLVLLAAAPLVPAPAYLRAVVLGKAELDAVERGGSAPPMRTLPSAGWVLNREGFPDLSPDARRRGAGATGAVLATTGPTAVVPAAGAGGWQGAAFGGGVVAGAAASSGDGSEPTVATPYLPPAEPAPRRRDERDRRGMLIGGLAGLIVLVAGVVILLSSHTKGTAGGTVGIGVTTVPATSTTAPRPTTPFTAVTVPPTLPASTVANLGHLIVGGSKSLDLGATASTTSLIVGNDGPAPLEFTATAAGTGLTVSPVAGALAAGASQTLTVALDRSAASPGSFTGTILIVSPGGSTSVTVTAVIDVGPTITGETQKPALVYTGKCPGRPATTSLITASVAGPLPLKVVVLHWQGSGVEGGGSATGSTAMTAVGAATTSNYSAALGPFTAAPGAGTSTTMGTAGTVDWWITAIDTANATGASMHHSLAVTC